MGLESRSWEMKIDKEDERLEQEFEMRKQELQMRRQEREEDLDRQRQRDELRVTTSGRGTVVATTSGHNHDRLYTVRSLCH